MHDFRAPVDDIAFTLDCVADAVGLDEWDADLALEVIGQFARFAETALAPLDARADAQGCRLEDGRVLTPVGFREAHAEYAAQGWPGLAISEAWDGQGMGLLLQGAVTEIFAGACHALQMLCGLATGAAHAIEANGSEAQRADWMPRLADGSWLATMCMTEPGAGSDLSKVRTTARREGGGWRLDGEKIFISGGDQDLTGGVLHLVLARTGDADSGSRGLSLFLCPSVLPAGERNGVRVQRLEEKLGLHGSPTCQLLFDGAQAELLGAEGQGLPAMFVMMNHARIDVGLQGVAHAARAADVAAAYASGRTQGGRSIDHHADVRRMLDEQRGLVLSARALCFLTLGLLEAGSDPDLVDFLTPVCKHFGSSAGIRAADLGIQVLGGYGYLREYGLERTWRDARVTAIYEGANGIHAVTLSGRLLRHREGAAADAFADWVRAVADSVPPGPAGVLREGLATWADARARVAAMADPGGAAEAFMQLTTALARLTAWALMLAAPEAGRPADLERLADGAFRELPVLAGAQAALIP